MARSERHVKLTGVPDGWHSVTPRIVVEDTRAMVRFLKAVFGATGEHRSDSPSQMRIGDSLVMVSEPGVRLPFPAFLYVYVEDADATYGRALEAGAVSLEEMRDTPYGDRRGMVQDPFGNVWQIATHKLTASTR
jgi:PhnB protein